MHFRYLPIIHILNIFSTTKKLLRCWSFLRVTNNKPPSFLVSSLNLPRHLTNSCFSLSIYFVIRLLKVEIYRQKKKRQFESAHFFYFSFHFRSILWILIPNFIPPNSRDSTSLQFTLIHCPSTFVYRFLFESVYCSF
jgi:hypothetical protein